ncbi:endo-1,4-beta-xylanase [Candidatus Daviesbacteria bacterium]|nr:endo-1,4-beta-xylanase [Candidatus Daviesbacteria bacterium]
MGKILLLILALILIVLIGEWFFEKIYPYPEKITYGVTFSPKAAKDLKLDWQQIYLKILDELKVRNIRLPTYWDSLEETEGRVDFSQLDFLLEEAAKRGTGVILVLGGRQPRWPECHIPSWAKKLSISSRQTKTLEFIRKVVDRYKIDDNPIIAWQVENEPMLGVFGEGCDPPDKKFLKSEVMLLRSLDQRPVIVTDSGELGSWITPMELSDVFGTTLYRLVYNPVLGYTNYPLLPYFYNLKSGIVRKLFAPRNTKTIIIELQAEPWSPTNNLAVMPIETQIKLFSLDNFKSYISFAKKTGFDTVYLWGVEWWYWMAQNGHPQYLDFARLVFDKSERANPF